MLVSKNIYKLQPQQILYQRSAEENGSQILKLVSADIAELGANH